MKFTTTTLIAPAVALLALVTFDSAAVVKLRTFSVNGSGACQSALPVFDVNIRKRPKAVQNEGAASAFVTCTYYAHGDGGDIGAPLRVDVYAATNDGVADTLTCTGVSGINGEGLPFVLKTVELPADGTQKLMSWIPSDFADNGPAQSFPSYFFGVSCNLNPGVGINDGYVYFQEDVGA